MKGRAHLLAIDDAPFDKHRDQDVLVVGVVTAGPALVEAVLTARLPVDAPDVTGHLTAWIRRSRSAPALRAVLFEGITIGGLGVIDLPRLAAALDVPVIAVDRKLPPPGRLAATLRRLGLRVQLEALAAAGPFHSHDGLHFHAAGIAPAAARQVLAQAAGRSRLPEGVRLAHLIGRAMVLGESRGS